MRVFAIRQGEFVEFRASRTPPKCLVSRYTRKGPNGRTTIKLEQRCLIGGKLLGYMKLDSDFPSYYSYEWKYKLPFFDRDGDAGVMPEEFAKLLLKASWRKKNFCLGA